MSFWLVVAQVWKVINSCAVWNSYKPVKKTFCFTLTRWPFSPLTHPCLSFSPFRKKKKKKALIGTPSPLLRCIFAFLWLVWPSCSVQLLRITVQERIWWSREEKRRENAKFCSCFSIQIGKFLLPVPWLIPGFLAGGDFWQRIKAEAHAFRP